MSFPQNPTNGMIFEDSIGVFYQYSAVTQSWFKVATPSIPLATPISDGLMSSDDFMKLTGILSPSPSITLSFEGCDDNDEEYSSGILKLTGDDDDIVEVVVSESNLHENTAVIDFKLDSQKLAQQMTALGTLRLTAPQGIQGDQGAPGQDGDNALPVGPQGPDGADGANAVWPGVLAEEGLDIAQQSRAIVDIVTRQVSATENYLVVRRANIGNPDACPSTIIPQDLQSPWLLAFDTGADGVASTSIISPATGAVCGWACQTSLFYFDIDAIIQSIRTHWVNYLNGIKTTKEALANTWLEAIMTLFNEQKAALCCALEGCRSRTRNVETRKYIEEQRLQAALGDFQIVIGGNGDRDWPPLDSGGECFWNIAPTNYNLVHISDPTCTIDWNVLCPPDDSINNNWRPWASLSIQAISVPNVEVTATVSDEPAAAEAASGLYTNGGVVTDDGELIQWAWHHDDWVLTIWQCKADGQYAAWLYNAGDNIDTWDFGGAQNVTACFMAGEIIRIDGVASGMTALINGSNNLVGGTATMRIV